ncbi:MAG: deoxyhypusine synthase family protein [Candidatus Krumholzibacteriia bacterium]
MSRRKAGVRARRKGNARKGSNPTSRKTSGGTPSGLRAAGRGSRGVRVEQRYGTGFDDELEAMVPVDLSRVDSVSDLVQAFAGAAIGARRVSDAADVLLQMTQDEECYVVATISGAMTVAKMGLVLCDMIDNGMVQAVVSTGALMAHGFVEAAGKVHFKYDPSMDDEQLFERGYNRVYDTLELERNLDDIEHVIMDVLDAAADGTPWSSARLNRELGAYLWGRKAGRGILLAAYENDVPVYVPAFTDSELGLDFAIHNHRREREGKPRLQFDPFLDLDDYTGRIDSQKRIGIFTIGGGVPRNWAQQVGPYLDILEKRAGVGRGLARFQYGVRICPEPAHWGGLSGCTYSEGVSWGKFVPPAEGGRYAEVFADATIVWPLVVKAVLQRLGRSDDPGRRRRASSRSGNRSGGRAGRGR